MQMIDVAWGKVTTKTVINCFEKSGISKEKQSEALLDADDPFKIFRNNWISLPYITPSSSQKEPPSNDIVAVVDSLTSTEPLMTDDESYMTSWMKKVLKPKKMIQMMFLMNPFAHNLVMCVKLWIYFKNTCYLVIMENLFTNA